MMVLLVAVLIATGVALLIALYLTLLASLYPERIRTNEVYQLRTNDLWVLRVCRYRRSRAPGEPVLLVHGMGANQNNFTSPENGCLVDYLCEKGYDCWTVDLRGSRSSQPPFERTRNDVRMEDFFTEDIPAVITHILKNTHYSKLHWVGHSMGGMLLYAYALTSGGDRIASGTTLGSPIDFSDASGKVPLPLITLGEKCPVFGGNLIRGVVPIIKALRLSQSVFPVNIRNLPKNMHSGHFINMLEDPLPGLMRQVKHWIKTKEYKLLDGELDIAEALPALPVPLLAFFAAKDPFIIPERALVFFASIKNDDKKAVVCAKANDFVEDYSHCDLAFSREAAREIFDPIAHWMEEHPCPVGRRHDDEVQRISATVLSAEKRAHILSGAAFAHSSDDNPVESDTASTPESEAVVDEAVASPIAAVEPTPATKKKAVAKKKTPAKKKSVVKKATVKKTAAKKPVAKKTPAKKTIAKKSASKKVTAQDASGVEVSPEALERAKVIRNTRNEKFTKIISALDESDSSGDSGAES